VLNPVFSILVLGKTGHTYPHGEESMKSLIDLYGAWNKPEKAEEWRLKLEQIEDSEE
jgi:hypothetical protein